MEIKWLVTPMSAGISEKKTSLRFDIAADWLAADMLHLLIAKALLGDNKSYRY